MPEPPQAARQRRPDAARPVKIDTTKAHSARMYDHYLGGKDHYAADRVTAGKAMQSWTSVRTAVRENRAFPGVPRTVDDFIQLAFTGLRLVGPGVVLVSKWRPEGTGPRPSAAEVSWYGGVAVKPVAR